MSKPSLGEGLGKYDPSQHILSSSNKLNNSWEKNKITELIIFSLQETDLK